MLNGMNCFFGSGPVKAIFRTSKKIFRSNKWIFRSLTLNLVRSRTIFGSSFYLAPLTVNRTNYYFGFSPVKAIFSFTEEKFCLNKWILCPLTLNPVRSRPKFGSLFYLAPYCSTVTLLDRYSHGPTRSPPIGRRTCNFLARALSRGRGLKLCGTLVEKHLNYLPQSNIFPIASGMNTSKILRKAGSLVTKSIHIATAGKGFKVFLQFGKNGRTPQT